MSNDSESQVAALKAKQGITVVLDQASLETVKLKSGQYALLNCDDHQVRKAILVMLMMKGEDQKYGGDRAG